MVAYEVDIFSSYLIIQCIDRSKAVARYLYTLNEKSQLYKSPVLEWYSLEPPTPQVQMCIISVTILTSTQYKNFI